MTTRVPITKWLTISDLDELLDQASWRPDASGLAWVFNQGWPITQNSKNTVLLNVTERLSTYRSGAALDQVKVLLQQGAQPLEKAVYAFGRENKTSALRAVAQVYNHWKILDETIDINFHVMSHVVEIWEALVAADAGKSTEAAAQYIRGTPFEAALACRQRERQTLSDGGERVSARIPRRHRA